MAADVLGRLGVVANSPSAEETIPVLARLCTEEEEPEVVASSINALGHLGRPEGLPHVLAKAGHPQASVRLAVAVALPSVVGDRRLEPTDPAMLALTGLTTDVDPDVRNWATFGLGTQLQVDGAVVRECLHARLADSHAETRAEALVGLARRHAPGIVGQVRDAHNAAVVGRLAVEAAALLRDPSLGATLARLADWWDVDAELLDEAQRRCAPFAVHEEANLVAARRRPHDLRGSHERVDSRGRAPIQATSDLANTKTLGLEQRYVLTVREQQVAARHRRDSRRALSCSQVYSP